MIRSELCKTILIAEDNDDIREALQETLRYEGYEVHTARNGKEALNQLKKLPTPSLVLLDLMMPVMSGWEFLDVRRGSSLLKGHQVVTLSAVGPEVGDPSNSQSVVSTDTAGCLTKPVSLKLLLSKVAGFCGAGKNHVASAS